MHRLSQAGISGIRNRYVGGWGRATYQQKVPSLGDRFYVRYSKYCLVFSQAPPRVISRQSKRQKKQTRINYLLLGTVGIRDIDFRIGCGKRRRASHIKFRQDSPFGRFFRPPSLHLFAFDVCLLPSLDEVCIMARVDTAPQSFTLPDLAEEHDYPAAPHSARFNARIGCSGLW